MKHGCKQENTIKFNLKEIGHELSWGDSALINDKFL